MRSLLRLRTGCLVLLAPLAAVACGSDGGDPTEWGTPVDSGGAPPASGDGGTYLTPDGQAGPGVDAAGSHDGGVPPGVDGSTTVDAAADSAPIADAGADAPFVPAPDCASGAELIYWVTTTGDLYSFAPATLTYTRIGTLGCDAGGATPNSMAVDRSATAWVNYTNGQIFKVSTVDASCVATSFQPGQSSFETFGMGFVSNGGTPPVESLYACALEGLGQIDTTTLALTQLSVRPVGTILGCEYTGTGDGRLFELDDLGPFVASGLSQTATTNGAETAIATLTGIQQGNDFAFSFWGGYFYFYTNPAGNSVVTQFDPSTQTYTVVIPDTGMAIDGAGVSTCAPFRK